MSVVPARRAAPWLVGLTVVLALHLVAQLASAGLLASATQVLLMPLLAAALVAGTSAPRGRLVLVVLVALFFSWLGDTLPRLADDDIGFLLMVGSFLLAQIAYVVAFWPYRRSSLLSRPVTLLPYVVVLVVLVLLCREQAGALLAPVVVYGVALVSMAVLATGLGPVAGVGGAIFLVSDALIALDAFAGVAVPASGFWVMLTYVVGQGLLVRAVQQRSQTGDATTDAALPSHA